MTDYEKRDYEEFHRWWVEDRSELEGGQHEQKIAFATWMACAHRERKRWEPCMRAIRLALGLMGLCLVCGAVKDDKPFKHRIICGYDVAVIEEEVL